MRPRRDSGTIRPLHSLGEGQQRTDSLSAAAQDAERRRGSVELHLREVAQLFDSLDPCPFYERDLDIDAEEYIVASTRELPQQPQVIVVYLDQSSGEAEARSVEKSIHDHFARKLEIG